MFIGIYNSMSVPAFKRSRSKVRRVRSHDALKKTKLSVCPNCKSAILPHHICANCGTYKTRVVMKTKTDKKAAQKTKKENKEKAAQKKTAAK